MTPIQSKSKIIFSWVLFLTAVLLFSFVPFEDSRYIVPALIMPSFYTLSSLFSKYEIEGDDLIVFQQFTKTRIPIASIKSVTAENNNIILTILMGFPKKYYAVKYNRYEDVAIYPKDELFIKTLENKINNTVEIKHNSEF